MTALAEEHLDPSRTEWLLNELLTLLATNPQQFTPDDLWDLLTFNCSLSPFSQESVQALANGACNALLNPNCPAGLIDIIGIGCWAIVISSLKRASNWPTLRRQALELATRQGLPRDSEVFIALAPPSAAWIGIAPRDVDHAVDDALALGGVRHVLHALEQRVELRVHVVRRVLALASSARLCGPCSRNRKFSGSG